MNFLFCHCPALLYMYQEGSPKVFNCGACAAFFHMEIATNDELFFYHFQIEYKGTTYKALFVMREEDYPGSFTLIREEPRPNVIIMELDHLPDYTPSNIIDKLPLLLTFS